MTEIIERPVTSDDEEGAGIDWAALEEAFHESQLARGGDRGGDDNDLYGEDWDNEDDDGEGRRLPLWRESALIFGSFGVLGGIATEQMTNDALNHPRQTMQITVTRSKVTPVEISYPIHNTSHLQLIEGTVFAGTIALCALFGAIIGKRVERQGI